MSSKFVAANEIATVALERPLITRTPGSYISYHLGVKDVQINLSGVVFYAHLVVLTTEGIDVILGMDWLSKHKGNIACEEKTVIVVNHSGVLQYARSDPVCLRQQ